MKARRIILMISIMIICTENMYSQQENIDQSGCIIKYDVISLLGDQVSNSMGVRLGLEWMNGERKSLNADIMYIFPCSSCGGTYTRIETEKTVGLMLSAEYRFYLFTGSSVFTGFHLGPQLAYQYTKADLNETINRAPNTYQVYRHMFIAQAMAGYQLKVAGPLYFDPSIGLGLRYISSRTENKLGQDSGQYEYIYNKDYESGAKWFPGFDISIKIGFKL